MQNYIEYQCQSCNSMWMELIETDLEDIECPECGSNDVEIIDVIDEDDF